MSYRSLAAVSCLLILTACAQASSTDGTDDEGSAGEAGAAGSGNTGNTGNASGKSGSGTSGSGTSGSGTAGTGTAGTGTAGKSGSGSAGKGTSGSGTAGTGTSGSGTAGTGTAGSGTAGSGTSGSGTAGTGTSGSGTAGTGTSGSGTAGTGTSGSGTAGSGTAGTGTAGTGTAGSGTNTCAHGLCEEGAALDMGCDSCVMQVCAAHATCCSSGWSTVCLGYAADMGCGCTDAKAACVDVANNYNGTNSNACDACLTAKCGSAYDAVTGGLVCGGFEVDDCVFSCGSGNLDCQCACITDSTSGGCYHANHDLYVCLVGSCKTECQ